MAFKMKSGNSPGFKNMGSSPVKQNVFNKKTTGGGDNVKLKTNENNVQKTVGISDAQTNQEAPPGTEPIAQQQVKLLPNNVNNDVTLERSTTIDTINRENKNNKSKAKFSNDITSFINGVVGIPGDLIGAVANKAGDVGGLISESLAKRKEKRSIRKQDKIDNPKPEKVKKVKPVKPVKVKKVKKVKVEKVKVEKVNKTTDKKSNNEIKVNKTTTKKPNNEITVNKQASNNYIYNSNPNKTPEAPKSKPFVKPKSNIRVMTKKELKKANKKPSKLGKSLSKFAKGDIASAIGQQIITQGIGAGIQALTKPKETKEKYSNEGLSGFSQMQFGRRRDKK